MNRVLQAFKSWEERKKQFEPILKAGGADERTASRLQLEFFRECRHRLRENVRPDEKPFLLLLHNHIAKLEKLQYPGLFRRTVSHLWNRLVTAPAFLKRESARHQMNLERLKEQLSQAGLGSISGKLDNHLSAHSDRVMLPLNCQLNAERQLSITVSFERDAHHNFHLDSLQANLLQNGERIKSHQFELEKWPGLNTGHILNLLDGRAIKQSFTDVSGQCNSRWIELGNEGIRHYDPVGLKIDDLLEKMPLTGNKPELLGLLENGQQVSTYWKHEGQLKTIHLLADPANQCIQLLDEKLKPVTAEKLNRTIALQTCKVKVLTTPERKVRKGIQHVH